MKFGIGASNPFNIDKGVVPLAYAILFNARDDTEVSEEPEEQKA